MELGHHSFYHLHLCYDVTCQNAFYEKGLLAVMGTFENKKSVDTACINQAEIGADKSQVR